MRKGCKLEIRRIKTLTDLHLMAPTEVRRYRLKLKKKFNSPHYHLLKLQKVVSLETFKSKLLQFHIEEQLLYHRSQQDDR